MVDLSVMDLVQPGEPTILVLSDNCYLVLRCDCTSTQRVSTAMWCMRAGCSLRVLVRMVDLSLMDLVQPGEPTILVLSDNCYLILRCDCTSTPRVSTAMWCMRAGCSFARACTDGRRRERRRRCGACLPAARSRVLSAVLDARRARVQLWLGQENVNDT